MWTRTQAHSLVAPSAHFFEQTRSAAKVAKVVGDAYTFHRHCACHQVHSLSYPLHVVCTNRKGMGGTGDLQSCWWWETKTADRRLPRLCGWAPRAPLGTSDRS